MSLLTQLQAFISAVGSDIKALNTAVSNSGIPSQTSNARKVVKTNGTTLAFDFPQTQSSSAGAIPSASTLGLGEELINTNDGKIYFKKSVGGVETVLVLAGQSPLGSSALMWTTDPNLMWTQ
ncbi:hypothetical protein [Polynucleobacter sp. AP-RePozz3-80-G7]|uniref:hypothetical protein n=1 Tax=Polynucleobacter sp. AP-RePozz3-80-G7 TaxID=2689105 RepID=UPI001C0E2222|nr:hypothetical protein [Polynucleobacter sp. AP-RePozz3-80-G7]MBU3640026.1 hypothetical protein [Polynucleobacter sp. AP-RePozz3-80-G7]